ncbi:unnamed protein product [Discosporangium mesarthrocarpum]
MPLYLPARSAHPLHSQKGFIKAELQRYVVTCSSHTDYLRLTNLFFKRLRSRGYPPKFLGGLFSSVHYSDRQSLLQTGTIHTSHRPPLIFATRFHPVWDRRDVGEALTLTLTQVPHGVKEVVNHLKKPLIDFGPV